MGGSPCGDHLHGNFKRFEVASAGPKTASGGNYGQKPSRLTINAANALPIVASSYKKSQHDPRFRRAERLAADAQYGCAMRTLHQSRIIDVRDSTAVDRLHDLHPAPPSPMTPLPAPDLPLLKHIAEDAVLQAVRRLNPNSALGPDRMHPRLFHLLAFTKTVSQSSLTGVSVLTAVVTRLAWGDLPEDTILLLSSVTLLPIQPWLFEMRPIAIGTAQRRVVTKVLLTPAIEDARKFLTPLYVANGIPRGLDAIVHDVRRQVDALQHDGDY